jgi:hypothetical protein
VDFAVTRHSGSRAPEDALELLWRRLRGERFEDVEFRRVGREIRAATGHDTPVQMERDEREEIGRQEILECLSDVCGAAAELELDWYAVAPRR